ncbi:MAG: hypothetical protein E7620_07005 [Ruminococcaceae bacterium]|nr:hypothetical protein [Oscillospiraceae bacterium]
MKKALSLVCVLAMLLSSFGMISVGADANAEISVWDGVVPEADLNYHFAGEGTEANPYLIQSAAELAQLAANVRYNDESTTYAGKYFRLIVDIDLNSKPWYGIGGCFSQAGAAPTTSPEDPRYWCYFAGCFDGDNHKIYNLTLADEHVNGLFGMVAPSPTGADTNAITCIKNLGIESGSSNLTKGRIGCLIGGGRFNFRVENCYNKASLSFDAPVTAAQYGGIIGATTDAGDKYFVNCYTTGSVTVTNCTQNFRVGGFGGSIAGKTSYFTNCYSFANVTVTHNKTASANQAAAGVLGGAIMDGPFFTNCYTNGDISSLNFDTGTIRAWHVGAFVGAIGSTMDAQRYVNSGYTFTENTNFGSADGVPKVWGVGNSAGVAANNFLTNVPVAEAKTLADILPAENNGFLKASGNAALATAPAFIGTQETAVVDGKYNIRFLMGLDSLNYDGVEFEITATYQKDGQTVTAKNGFVKLTTAWRDILAEGASVTSISNGHNYMSALVVKGVPADTEITFEVKSYVYNGDVKTLVDTDTFTRNVASAAN